MNGKYYGRLEVRYHKKEAARLEHIKNKRKRSKTMVKGYKVFNPDWTCKGKQYTCPGTFEEDVNPSACNVGMHFCKNAADCFRYYDFDPNNHVAEVIAHGTVEGTASKIPDGIPTGGLKEIVCKVDFTAWNERRERAKRMNELQCMMNNRVRDLQETALFEILASKDPELKAMLDEYKTLRGC